ncbi:Protein of unknown function [Lactobacillus helveticus CIRM-BIA 951]|uniref:Uncharacterized protein n=1 Tax=Lactobacillus helveticus CIRM-BIA 951 TaxID=1226334 RepID=U6F885_LACHE|nr:Protein of unknown function [Lactobacillus helveticus CIRM-BIA 951]
MYQIIPQAKLL